MGALLSVSMIFAGLAGFAADLHAAGLPEACQEAEASQEELTRLEALANNPKVSTASAETYRSLAEAERKKQIRQQKACDKVNAKKQQCESSGADWKWDTANEECVDKRERAKANPNEGECSDAELMRGSNLRGEACKAAANTVKDVAAQQEAIIGTTTAAATAYSGFQASQATGAQADAQVRQQNIMQALAITKIASGGLQIAGAAQLKGAAGEAETASSNISEAHKKLKQICDAYEAEPVDASQMSANAPLEMTREQCFYRNAKQYDVQVDYLTFERMMSGASQSQEQADRANALAKTSMITGLADTLVGVQALVLSRQAQQNNQAMGVVPQLPPGYSLAGGASMGGMSGGAGAPVTPAGPTDFGNGDGGGMGLGGTATPLGNGIKGGRFAQGGNAYKPERSTVSTAGGGGGGGGGAGGGKPGSRRPASKSNSTAGEYNLGGGGLGGPRGGGERPAEGGNAFADALAKLFPQNPAGTPVVDTRGLASQPEDDPDTFVGSEVYASEPSLFEMISSRYRKLSGEGSI